MKASRTPRRYNFSAPGEARKGWASRVASAHDVERGDINATVLTTPQAVGARCSR